MMELLLVVTRLQNTHLSSIHASRFGGHSGWLDLRKDESAPRGQGSALLGTKQGPQAILSPVLIAPSALPLLRRRKRVEETAQMGPGSSPGLPS